MKKDKRKAADHPVVKKILSARKPKQTESERIAELERERDRWKKQASLPRGRGGISPDELKKVNDEVKELKAENERLRDENAKLKSRPKAKVRVAKKKTAPRSGKPKRR
jgi:hypothetical protein